MKKISKEKYYNLIKENVGDLSIKNLPIIDECSYHYYRGINYLCFRNNEDSYSEMYEISLFQGFNDYYLISDIDIEIINEYDENIFRNDNRIVRIVHI